MSVPIGAETADKLAHVCVKENEKAAHGSSFFLILHIRAHGVFNIYKLTVR
jgi:hypothetical protein